jgi:hypothetical protein
MGRESRLSRDEAATDGRARVMQRTTDDRTEWLTSRHTTCCARGARHVTGADVVRIARTLAVEPWHFTQTTPAAADDPLGVVLDKGRRRVAITLANAAKGCVFLVVTGSGAGRCGLGEVAPVACRLFPAEPDGGSPDEEHQHLAAEWTADQAHWEEVVRRWNAQANAVGTPGVEDFHRYLLEAQHGREAGTAWPEEVRP